MICIHSNCSHIFQAYLQLQLKNGMLIDKPRRDAVNKFTLSFTIIICENILQNILFIY